MKGRNRLVGLALACVLLPALAQTSRAQERGEGAPAEQRRVGAEAEGAGAAGLPDYEPLTHQERWRIEPPPYELNVEGHWWDPYNQNVLKGDYPVIGDDIFVKLIGVLDTKVEGFAVPTPSALSTDEPGSIQFFGDQEGALFDEKMIFKFEMQEGATTFKPFEWQIGIAAVGNVNYLTLSETTNVDPDPREGTARLTTHGALEEAFFELHLVDISKRYDFISMKLGRQPFNSDFRNLIFSDVNQGVRFFGTANGSRYIYNLIYLNPAEKDSNSELNSFELRDQNIGIANLYVQDFFINGYQTEFSLHYLDDHGEDEGFVFNNQGFLVRPDPIGLATPHDVEVFYAGWTGEGHIGRLNVSHAFYGAFGEDSNNPIAGRPVDINGQLAFLELSIDRDWIRYQTAVFFTSGDGDPRDDTARGFDSILQRPLVLGGNFSWWNRQTIRIADRGGVQLMGREAIIPNLRSNKIEGQPNFVNPGILQLNAATITELTPELRMILNGTYLRFPEIETLELLLKQQDIRSNVGVDVSLGFEYRPLLNNNIIIKGFTAGFQPLGGFKDIYQSDTLWQAGTEVLLIF